MPAVRGFAVAGANQIVPPVDWVDPPTRIDNVYGARVCAVDADGNEIAGICLPKIRSFLSGIRGGIHGGEGRTRVSIIGADTACRARPAGSAPY
jgi:hypothetical protein